MRKLSLDEQTLQSLREYFAQKPEVITVFLFGSYLTPYFNERSDLDFAVLYDSVPTLQQELAIEGDVSEVLKTDRFDLVNLNKAPLIFKHKVVATGKIIYERDYVKTSDFLEYVYRMYCDLEYDYRMLSQEYEESLKESYLHG